MTARPHIPGIAPFGVTAEGRQVDRITLADDRLTVSLLSLGATLQGLWLDDIAHSLTLGSDSLRDYETAASYFGALVGPVANRIAGASANVAGQHCRFDANEGPTTLHSGPSGVHSHIWHLADQSETGATFTLDLGNGLGGFPGNRQLSARFSLPGNATLRLDLAATTDKPTPMSLANHSYWNLDGMPCWTGHRLQIAADHWLPVDARLIPTGEVRPAAAEMDFRHPRRLLAEAPALDHNFCLAAAKGALTKASTLTGASGISMQILTTEPGLQVYDGRSPIRPGDAPYAGLALEPQLWPDALHHPDFPNPVITPDSPYRQTTEWRFSRR